MSGSNTTYNRSAGSTINVTGSNDIINMVGTGVVNIVSGTNDQANMSNGTFNLSLGTTGILNGSGNTATAAWGDSIIIEGSNNIITAGSFAYVGITSGTNDTVSMSNNGHLVLSTGATAILVGSLDTITTGVGDSILISGNNDAVTAGNASYVQFTSGNGDAVILNGGNLVALSNVTNYFLTGSNDTLLGGTNNQVNIAGSNDAATFGTGVVNIVSGTNDQANMSNGTFNLSLGTTGILNGSGNTATAAWGDSIIIEGSNNIITAGSFAYVGITSGTNDTVSMSNNGHLVLSTGATAILVGSLDTITTGVGDSILISGNNDAVTAGNASYVQFTSGNGDAVILNGGNLVALSNVTNYFLTGSNDTLLGGTNNQVNIAGSNDAATLGNGDYINLISGSYKNTISESNGTLFQYGSTSATLTGSGNAINGASGVQISVLGSNNAVDLTTKDTVTFIQGDGDAVILNSGTIIMDSGVTNSFLTGSNDTASIGTGDQVNLAGSNDTINAVEGSTIVLNAGDTGDTINMIGGTVVIGTGVSGIIINGTGDVLSGQGASLAGPITTTILQHNVPGQPPIFTTITTTPPVVYYAGDISDLVSYFEANPYLSENQIKSLESESNYTANLDSYLTSANLYGSPTSLPSNVMAMLDGYSAVYTALAGVSPNIFSEDAYIEQQVGWAATNYPMPSTIQVSGVTLGIESILQNLMPALESQNSNTQSLVSEALSLLVQGNAGAAGGNQTPMLNDTTAEMLLAIAETSGYSASTQSSTEVYTPGRSGHWQIIVNGDGTYTQTYKSPPLIQTVLADFDNYIAPIIDVVAVIALNPEFIAATALSASVQVGVEVAADAVNLIQAGQDFATGADLQGVFSVLNTVGGALQQVGYAENGLSAANALLPFFGEALSEGTAIAQGIDGLVSGGNILSALSNALGSVGGIAGLAGYTPVQQLSSIGAGLASVAQAAEAAANGQGNTATDIFEAISSLAQAQQTYDAAGGSSGVSQDVAFIDQQISSGITALAQVGNGLLQLAGSIEAGLLQDFGALAQDAFNTQATSAQTLSDQYINALLDGAYAGENASTVGDQETLNGTSDASAPLVTPKQIEAAIDLARSGGPNAQNSILYAALFPNSNLPSYHSYGLTTPMLDFIGTTQDGFTLQNVFNELLIYAAPGQNGQVATNFDYDNLFGLFPITQIVNPANYSVENVTLPGHIFNPGNVIRQVVQYGNEIFIQTIGQGNGIAPGFNDDVGQKVIFPSLDNSIRNAFLGP